jgi:hypothetical protein
MSSSKNIFITVRSKWLVAVFVTVAVFMFHSNSVHAATLGISPANENVSAGNTFIVRVIVDSQGQSINAVSGGLTFSNDLLTLTSISKNNSIVSLWAQDPSYSNSSGTASFQGVILNGFSGTGTVLTVAFKAKSAGIATIGLASSSSSVLLNDGQGTNVLSGTNSDSITIKAAPAAIPAKATAPATIVPAPSVTPPLPALLPLPVITNYQNHLVAGNFVVVKGSAAPNSTFSVTLASTYAVVSSSLTADANGAFTYVSDNKVSAGTYNISIVMPDGRITDPITIIVKGPLAFVVASWLQAIVSIKIALIWVILLIALCLYLWHRNRVLRRHLSDAIERIHSIGQK